MKHKLLCFLLSFIMLFSIAVPSFAELQEKDVADMTEEEYQQLIEENAEKMGVSVEEYKELLQNTMFKYYKTYIKEIADNYKFGISLEELYELTIKELVGVDKGKLESAISSVFEGLDVNSQYFDQNSYSNFTQKIDENLHGVGVIVTNLDGKIIITGFPVDNAPAEAAGICPGDELVSVDGKDVKGMDVNEIAPYIRGELGTQVTLGILRDGQPLSFTLTRIEMKQNPVTYRYLDNGILYLQLSAFNKGAAAEVEKVMKEADSKGIVNVILDLRNNSGGFGSEAYDIASLFLPKGLLIATMEYKDETRNEVFHSTAKFKKKKYNTVLLVNEYSASASELLAAAFQDHEMGVLIGTNTYGKGTGQQIYYLNAFDSGYKLTVCQYRTPDGTLLPATGLQPDRKVENPMVYINKNSDVPQMTMERKLYVGDRGEDVKACQIRLSMLGYEPGNQTGYFDQKTADAVSRFQNDQKLYPCGDLDNATQGKLYTASIPLQVVRDDQMKAAIDYFSE